MREVPLRREVTERLRLTLAPYAFKHLSIGIWAKGDHDINELAESISRDVKELLDAGRTELARQEAAFHPELCGSLLYW